MPTFICHRCGHGTLVRSNVKFTRLNICLCIKHFGVDHNEQFDAHVWRFRSYQDAYMRCEYQHAGE